MECREYNGKADIWSVGCIFYEMLVGISPFQGTNETDLLRNIKTKELSVPKHIVTTNVSIEILVKVSPRVRRLHLGVKSLDFSHKITAAVTNTLV